MTLAPGELRDSRVWRHRWSTLLVSLLVLACSAIVGYSVSLPALLYIPLALVDITSTFFLLRLTQLYHAPKSWKGEAPS